MGGCQTYGVSICPPCSYTPYIWMPLYSDSFNSIFIYFSTLVVGMGVVRLRGVHMPPCLYAPIHLDTLIHLDAPLYICMSMFVCSPYVWMPPV